MQELSQFANVKGDGFLILVSKDVTKGGAYFAAMFKQLIIPTLTSVVCDRPAGVAIEGQLIIPRCGRPRGNRTRILPRNGNTIEASRNVPEAASMCPKWILTGDGVAYQSNVFTRDDICDDLRRANALVFKYSPNSSSRQQPNDVAAIFRNYKTFVRRRNWTNSQLQQEMTPFKAMFVDNVVSWLSALLRPSSRVNVILKNFLQLLPKLFATMFSTEEVRRGWHETGQVPFSCGNILKGCNAFRNLSHNRRQNLGMLVTTLAWTFPRGFILNARAEEIANYGFEDREYGSQEILTILGKLAPSFRREVEDLGHVQHHSAMVLFHPRFPWYHANAAGMCNGGNRELVELCCVILYFLSILLIYSC